VHYSNRAPYIAYFYSDEAKQFDSRDEISFRSRDEAREATLFVVEVDGLKREELDRSTYTFRYLDPTEGTDASRKRFLANYVQFSLEALSANMKLRRLCFEWFLMDFKKIKSWEKTFEQFSKDVREDILGYFQTMMLYNWSRNSTLYKIGSFEDFKANTMLQQQILTSLDGQQKKTLASMKNNKSRSINNCVYYCAKTVCDLDRQFRGMDLSEQSNVVNEFGQYESTAMLFTSNRSFMEALVKTDGREVEELTYICKLMDDTKTTRSHFKRPCQTISSYTGMSLPVKRRKKGSKYLEEDSTTEQCSNKVTAEQLDLFGDCDEDSVSSTRIRCVPEPTKVDSSEPLSDCSSPKPINPIIPEPIELDSNDNSSTLKPLSPMIIDETPISFPDSPSSNSINSINDFTMKKHSVCIIDENSAQWTYEDMKIPETNVSPEVQLFSNMQSQCYATDTNVRISVQWVENQNRPGISASDISKFRKVRREFLSVVQSSPADNRQKAIEEFLRTRAFFQLQVKFDAKSYNFTKPDGLCLLRSLKQLRDMAQLDLEVNNTVRNYGKELKALDVKLSNMDDRERFIQFLIQIVEALDKVSYNSHSGLGGDFLKGGFYTEMKQNLHNVQRTIEHLTNFEGGNWSKFKLDSKYWCGVPLLKCISHGFSPDLLSFPGSYFLANAEDGSEHNKHQDNSDQYAMMVLSMKNPTNSIIYSDPVAIRYSKLKLILADHKMVLARSHFFPHSTVGGIHIRK
jgi:hypothetical protein